jgi:glycosyltransferase involved in cell wall biosynthesis
LPHLWGDGWLGGRTFDVLADRLPIAEIELLLDRAHARYPERALLTDYRAPREIAASEIEALAEAKSIITPSSYVANLFGERSVLLPWAMPSRTTPIPGQFIAFPGPTAARKGAYEVREAARRLGLTVSLSANELEGEDFWEGVDTVRPDVWLDRCRLVVQPSIVEEQPRKLLQALAAGIPVITTEVCGLGERDGVTTVPPCDADALAEAIQKA